jgi:molecular chaperone GrpE (heat shock protein)
MSAKRSSTRRSDEDRIAALQARIENLKNKLEQKTRPDQVVLREVPKLERKLRRFAQIAQENGRSDIANSTVAFMAGLERMVETPPEPTRRARRTADDFHDAPPAAL